jgi:hypothetical protein
MAQQGNQQLPSMPDQAAHYLFQQQQQGSPPERLQGASAQRQTWKQQQRPMQSLRQEQQRWHKLRRQQLW